MTHNELVTLCALRFRDTANSIYTTAEWSEYLNIAYMEGNALTPLWPWLETQTATLVVDAATRFEALPADCLQINAVYDNTDDYPLVPLQGRTQHMSIYNFDSTETGLAETYRVRSSLIEVYPLVTANTTLTIDYVGCPPVLATTAEPYWPEQFHRFLATGALALAYEDDGNAKAAERFFLKWKQELDMMMRFVLAFRVEGYPLIIDNFYGD